MAMVSAMNPMQMKDSRWLTLEVCREFQRSKCSRSDLECKFAHPPPHIEIQNGRVTCCFDSIKGKCQRKEPPCKYLHPPQHLKEQLLQNGRNNLIIKNLQMQAITAGLSSATILPAPTAVNPGPLNPYLSLQQQAAHPYSTYMSLGAIPQISTATGMMPSTLEPVVAQPAAQNGVHHKSARSDRIETSSEGSSGSASSSSASESTITWQAPQFLEAHSPPPQSFSQVYLQGMSGISMIPAMKRAALATDAKMMPAMYHQPMMPPAAAAYQQALAAMQMPQPPYIPVSIAGAQQPTIPRY